MNVLAKISVLTYNQDATDTNNTMCVYANQGELLGYHCPVDGADPECIAENPKNKWCDNAEIRGCDSSIKEDACREGNAGDPVASTTVTWHIDDLCRYSPAGKNCYSECFDGDMDGDGKCNKDDICNTNNPCQNGATGCHQHRQVRACPIVVAPPTGHGEQL